jgi:hypothetical protein
MSLVNLCHILCIFASAGIYACVVKRTAQFVCGVEFLESDGFFSYYGVENWLKSYPKIIALMGVKDSVISCGRFINSFFSVCDSSFLHILQT